MWYVPFVRKVRNRPLETESRLVVAKGWKKEGMDSDCFFFGVMQDVLELDKMVAQFCESNKNHGTIPFEKGTFYSM